MAADQLVFAIMAALGVAGIAGAAFLLGRRSERRAAEREGRAARVEADRLLSEARRDAEAARSSLLVEAREEIVRGREAWEQEAKARREELARQQHALDEQSALLARKLLALDERQQALERQAAELTGRERAVAAREAEAQQLYDERRRQLEQLAGMTEGDAKAQLIQEMTEQARSEAAATIRDIKDDAQRNAEREAKKIIALAVQRLAAEQTSEIAVSAVSLPSDEMKGRIIGREGRNIRAFETATGVDVIIDDTPDTVVISCFDPLRREVARRALEQLITDGRIHPGRIEDVVQRVRQELDAQIVEAGEEAVYELGIHGMHQELVKLIGRMKYRSSYGQNLYHHSKEVAWLAGIMAAELRLDAYLAKRAALLHDVGKVLTHRHEGTHVELGVEVAKKYGEHPVVINAIAAHHNDVPHESAISVIVQAADAVSGARPGARREAFETYVKRLSKLEEIAGSYAGVEKAYAIQAGREVRIVVVPDAVDDGRAAELSELVARRIESELQYPGQIKVVVIRETRAVEIAR